MNLIKDANKLLVISRLLRFYEKQSSFFFFYTVRLLKNEYTTKRIENQITVIYSVLKEVNSFRAKHFHNFYFF